MTSFPRGDAARASGITVPIRPGRTFPSTFGRSRVRRPEHPARLPRLNRERVGPPLAGVGPSRSGRMSVPRPEGRRNPAEGPLQSSAFRRQGRRPPRRPPPRACRRSRFRRGGALRPAGRAGPGTGPRPGARQAEPQIRRDRERRLGLGRALRVQEPPRRHVVTADSLRHPLRASGGPMTLTSSPGPRLAGSFP